DSGMRFVQFYFGLPFAMVILCLTVVPFFYRAKVYTAYEYLESRFDAKTRSLTSFLFLVSRGMACGVIIAAPSVILSIVLGWNELLTVLLMGVTTTLYTMFGGVQAVTWTDVKQMVVIFLGLGVIFFVILGQLPETVSLGGAIELAGMTGRMKMVDPQLNLNETYTLWSGLLGGLFLALSYFGCDQSQVQRFLTARSVSEGRSSLLMSAFVKIPMQLLILFIGVLVFIFYQFVQPPLIFKADDRARVESLPRYHSLESDYSAAFAARRHAALDFPAGGGATARAAYEDATSRISEARRGAIGLIREQTGRNFSDVNYVFPTFVTTYAPIGVVGLIIAAIFAA
ncbi:MAG: sodium:solute symporter family transporter, partial [Acidobacteriota bacterium]